MRHKLTSFLRALLLLTVIATAVHPLTGLEGLQVGMKAPLFQLEDLEGRTVSLVNQRDANVTVVVFWATWGDHSAVVLERLQELYSKHTRSRMSVLAVNVDKQTLEPTDLNQIRNIVSRLRISFPVQLDDGLQVFREYGVVAVPSTVVLDKEGVIRGEMAAYPIAQREDLFDLIDAMAEGREIPKVVTRKGYIPVPKAVRYYNLARAMAERGMVDVVDDNLTKSIDTDPNFVLPLLLLAKLHRERAETEEAVEYQGSLNVTATFSQERDNHLKEALRLIESALQLAPEDTAALTEAALIHLSRGEESRAREMLARAIEAESTYTPARFIVAGLLLQEGKVEEGEKEFQSALSLNPLGYEGHHIMARAYEEIGMTEKAIEAYRKVYEILRQEEQLFPYSYGR